MKINPDFTLRTIGDISLIVPLKAPVFQKEQMITTNGSGALLWEKLAGGVQRRNCRGYCSPSMKSTGRLRLLTPTTFWSPCAGQGLWLNRDAVYRHGSCDLLAEVSYNAINA